MWKKESQRARNTPESWLKEKGTKEKMSVIFKSQEAVGWVGATKHNAFLDYYYIMKVIRHKLLHLPRTQTKWPEHIFHDQDK